MIEINYLGTLDRGKELERAAEIPLNLEKIVLKVDYLVKINLVDWMKNGLRIGVSVEGLGQGYFNEEPYSDKEFALKEYQNVVAQVQKGNYFLEFYGDRKLKLLLTEK